jgi:beta-glucosidase-like glycosyl hydrolase
MLPDLFDRCRYVLLKNAGGILPLKPGAKVAVLGPQGLARHGLFSDYSNSPCADGHECVLTIAEAVARVNGGGGERAVAVSCAASF